MSNAPAPAPAAGAPSDASVSSTTSSGGNLSRGDESNAGVPVPMLSQPLRRRPSNSGEVQQLLPDPHFLNGFVLIDPKPGKPVAYGEAPGPASTGKPMWELTQWASRFPLQATNADRMPDGSIRYANAGKTIILGAPGSEWSDLFMGIKGSAEYGTRARKQGEFWPHLIVGSEINSPALNTFASVKFHLESKLLYAQLFKTPDYSPDLHSAQFGVFFTIQNMNRVSAGYGKYFWFGVLLYDDRHRLPEAYMAQEGGKDGSESTFIYILPSTVFTQDSVHDRKWVTIDQDILPLIQEGLRTAWFRGFLNESHSLGDYRIANMTLGWEVTGILDGEMLTRNLSLLMTPGTPPKAPMTAVAQP